MGADKAGSIDRRCLEVEADVAVPARRRFVRMRTQEVKGWGKLNQENEEYGGQRKPVNQTGHLPHVRHHRCSTNILKEVRATLELAAMPAPKGRAADVGVLGWNNLNIKGLRLSR
jgi:hypothetical protein